MTGVLCDGYGQRSRIKHEKEEGRGGLGEGGRCSDLSLSGVFPFLFVLKWAGGAASGESEAGRAELACHLLSTLVS